MKPLPVSISCTYNIIYICIYISVGPTLKREEKNPPASRLQNKGSATYILNCIYTFMMYYSSRYIMTGV